MTAIWSDTGGPRNLRALRGTAHRVVEAQHVIATRKLVDSDAEQALLEELIEASKPPVPVDGAGLHYLLFSPFRYPPLRHGSRFGARHERGIWYGAEEPLTALAEAAYYRLCFLSGTEATLPPLELQLSLFAIGYASSRGIDLCDPVYAPYRDVLASKSRYDLTQALGATMRAAGVEAFRFWSARHDGGRNVGLFAPVFTASVPRPPQTWWCFVSREQVEVVRHDFFAREVHRFARLQFEVDGQLPWPAP